MKFFQWIFSALLLSFVLSGCQKALQEPELIDPIYKDLSAMLEKKKHELESEKSKLGAAKSALERSEVRSVQKKILAKDYALSLENIRKLEESTKYYEIRTERRKFLDRMTYKKAFDAGKPWPDPNEYSGYQVNKRLNEAPRQWSERVPRLNDRLPSSKGKKSEKSGESPEGGESSEAASSSH